MSFPLLVCSDFIIAQKQRFENRELGKKMDYSAKQWYNHVGLPK